MARIYVCFLWHMHQPFYKDLVTGEYRLPWTRMHALKDYYGMVSVLADFPQVHQTFNLVPSLALQIEEYASGNAADPFLRAALKPAEELTQAESEFILQYFFQANESRMIQRYSRYAELYKTWLSVGRTFSRARRLFDTGAMRDLQVLSQLAWFDEEFHESDELVRSLSRKERSYSVEDQRLLGLKQIEVIGKVLPVYREYANSGQIEISTTPYYHPILPLLCDSDIAGVSHPHVALPSRFSYPQDAREQLGRARTYMAERFGSKPAGLWPSEGSVSDQALELAAECGYRWFATDNGVLSRTLGVPADPTVTYRPYLWRRNGYTMHGLFRDHHLSDLIGFVYSRMNAAEAADHFLQQIRSNCAPILRRGADAVVPVFLDGENAWEYYDKSGRSFLRDLYRRITEDPQMEALTVSEALSRVKPQEIAGIFPGSWINANFDVWIGAEEDNKAWEYLLRARQAYDRVASANENSAVSSDRLRLAWEELLIAEGSDWCWWYGPEHESANRPDFDELFRNHLANVYTLLGLAPPEELSRAILRMEVKDFHQPPTGPVQAVIDGEVTSYFEWLGAGLYRLDQRTGAMHGQRFFVRELRYGTDGHNLYLRLDFVPGASLTGSEVRILVKNGDTELPLRSVPLNGNAEGVESVCGKVCEIRLQLTEPGVPYGQQIRFQLSLWQGGLPVEALPSQGSIALSPAEPTDLMI